MLQSSLGRTAPWTPQNPGCNDRSPDPSALRCHAAPPTPGRPCKLGAQPWVRTDRKKAALLGSRTEAEVAPRRPPRSPFEARRSRKLLAAGGGTLSTRSSLASRPDPTPREQQVSSRPGLSRPADPQFLDLPVLRLPGSWSSNPRYCGPRPCSPNAPAVRHPQPPALTPRLSVPLSPPASHPPVSRPRTLQCPDL